MDGRSGGCRETIVQKAALTGLVLALGMGGLATSAAASPENAGNPNRTLNVTPNDGSGLPSPAAISVTGAGFPGNSQGTLMQCTADTFTCSTSRGPFTAAAFGGFSTAVNVTATFAPDRAGPLVDCRVVACVIFATTNDGISFSKHRITFAVTPNPNPTPTPTPAVPGDPPAPPGESGAGGGAGALDLSAPTVSAYGVSSPILKVGKAATPLNGLAAAAPHSGTTFRYTLSEAATATIDFQRVLPGRKQGTRCVKKAKGKRCNRYVSVGRLMRTSRAGINSIPFSGRLANKALRPGRYRALLTAKDAAGNASTPKALSLRVLPQR